MKAINYLQRIRKAISKTSGPHYGLIQITDITELDSIIEELENYIIQAEEPVSEDQIIDNFLEEVPKI